MPKQPKSSPTTGEGSYHSVSNPTFTVVIPAYNAEKFVEYSLGSVVAQTFGNFEIILVENGSKDRTYDVAKEFLDKSMPQGRYQIIRKAKNVGIAGARNEGIRAAQGRYIAFLDADDVWYPDKLELVYGAFKKNPSSALVCHDENLVFWDVDSNDKATKILGKMVYGPYEVDMYEKLLFGGNRLSGSATTVEKTKLVEAGLFCEDLDIMGTEDYDMWMRLSKICRFYFLHEILGESRVGKFNTSANFGKQVQSELTVVKRHFEMLPKEKQSQTLFHRRCSMVYLGIGWGIHRQGRFSESRGWYMKALREYPLPKAYGGFLLSLFGVKW